MRPRFFKRGKASPSPATKGSHEHRFNEAALFQARKAGHVPVAVGDDKASMRPRFFKRGKPQPLLLMLGQTSLLQ